MLAITTLFLAAVFLAAEFYRCRKRITGAIQAIAPLDGDCTGLLGARLQVKTSDAGEITAFVSGCQICLSRFEIGKSVSLVPGPDGYIVHTSWIPAKNCSPACPMPKTMAIPEQAFGGSGVEGKGMRS